jgi:hypothetical protein
MGAIFPMAALTTRLGLVKKRHKEARRSALAEHGDHVPSRDQGVSRLPALLDKPVPLSPLQRHNRRRRRAGKQKAEARRLKEDMAIGTATKDLLKAVLESVVIIARLPRDELGRARTYRILDDGGKIPTVEKTSRLFRRFTLKERRALSAAVGKYRAAAKRMRVSVSTAWSVWETTLAEYKRDELTRTSAKPGGIL